MDTLKTWHQIRNALAVCLQEEEGSSCRCVGVQIRPTAGIIPRCSFVESGYDTGPHVAIVGENPGHIGGPEKRAVIKAWEDSKSKSWESRRKAAYGGWLEVYEKYFKNYPYYGPIEILLQELGIRGDRLWTDIYKCEKVGGESVPKKTQYRCADRHLRQELRTFKNEHRRYIVIAVGNVSYNMLRKKQDEDEWRQLIPKLAYYPHPSQGHLMAYMSREQDLKRVFDEFRSSPDTFRKFK